MIPVRKPAGGGGAASFPAGGSPGQVLGLDGASNPAWLPDQTGLIPPSGGVPGQVLTISEGGYVWGTPSAGGGVVALDNFGTPSLNPATRPTASDSYRMNGPTREASASPLTYTSVTIPLRNVAGGEQVCFLILDEVTGSNRVIKFRRDFTLTAGQTEINIAGPFVVPANKTYHFVCGDATGTANLQNRFYGEQTGLVISGQPVAFWFTNSAIVEVEGQAINASVGSKGNGTQRIVLLNGQNVTKGVLGPLSPSDMPRVKTAAELANGSQALLTATMPPRMIYRHTDGTLYYGPAYSLTP